MYQLKNIDTKELSKITVRNQEEIIKRIGQKFHPEKAYEVLRHDTQGFTIDVEDAKEADELFMKLLEKNGVKSTPPEKHTPVPKPKKSSPSPEKSKPTELELQNRNRERKFKQIKIRLRLSSQK